MAITVKSDLGPIQKKYAGELARLQNDDVVKRIWYRDPTVWKNDITEIANRLGWLDCPWNMSYRIGEIQNQIREIRQDGITQALLLGMGGSSLAPEVFSEIFGVSADYLDLHVLDSTHPEAVQAYAHNLDPAKTLFIPATKSGDTLETMSFLKFFYNRALEDLGEEEAGRHFVVITDPNSDLVDLAEKLHFRHIFLNDPNIGGRYSALSCFGLVAASAIGVNLATLLERARATAETCRHSEDNPGIQLGAFMGAGALAGRDKLTLLLSSGLKPFGSWIEQLVAESTGKEEKGILPVDGEPILAASDYGKDRIFVHLHLADEDGHAATARELSQEGHPVFDIHLDDTYDLGGAYFLWEWATVIAGRCLQINPFDQPNVQAAKIRTGQMVESFELQGKLPSLEPVLQEGDLTLYGAVRSDSLCEAIDIFLKRASANVSYLALQAYLPITPEIDEALQNLRRDLLQRTHIATTVGYGPRFLHSTGQLHKGDAGHGLFIQLTADPVEDAPIPDEPGSFDSSITFGVLAAAQAMGDRQALLDARRQVMRIHLGKDVRKGIGKISDFSI